ncbi:MAG: ribokinase [Chloroflexi bacterium]|nr:ribokinase [Chloroflexota bacterium]
MDAPSLLRWLPAFREKTILVLGDLCLDEYIIGKAQRLSREAPVPVLELQERFVVPGAACNPALNVQALGGRALVAGVIGNDEPGRQLLGALHQAGIDTAGVVTDDARPTTLKTRVLASHLFPQQVARVDRVQRDALSRGTQRSLRRFLEEAVPRADAVLLSDYRNGVVDAPLVRFLLGLNNRGVLVTVDSQGDFAKFRGVSVLRCNREEAEAYLRRPLDSDAAFAQAGTALKKRLGVATVVVTRGAQGMSLVDVSGAYHFIAAANPSEVYDVTGAGDTVIAVLTLGLAAGAPAVEAAHLANLAAGLVVRKLGNATVTPKELAVAVHSDGPV